MENLVEYIVKQLVNEKEQVNVTRVEREDAVVIVMQQCELWADELMYLD